MAQGVHHLATNITCHAWNGACNKLALCPGNNEIHIYSWSGSAWNRETILTEHDQLVTGIDWAPKTNRIVSCSEDRNAYVWVQEGNTWKPTLVILRINRAAYHVQWSPKEDKFAVSSGAKVVAVCYFEDEHDWWVSKHIKKHRSTVLSSDWHPNNMLVLTASSDYKARIFSGFVKGIDKKPDSVLGFGNKIPFGELLMELDVAEGWVHQAKWSPSGNEVAFVGHDSSICFANVQNPTPQVQKIRTKYLPFCALVWVNDTTVVAAGHECAPFLFKNQGGWKEAANMDAGGGGGGGSQAAQPKSAFNMWQNKVDKGQGGGTSKKSTKHQNCITQISLTSSQVTTTGVDGNIVFWKKP